MKAFIILILFWIIQKISGVKNWIIIAAVFLFSCSKEKIDTGLCVTMTTYEEGAPPKVTTTKWNNGMMPNDTIYCSDQTIVTIIHKCN
jgi:hypothetical protein